MVLDDIEELRGIEFEGERYALLFVTHNRQVLDMSMIQRSLYR